MVSLLFSAVGTLGMTLSGAVDLPSIHDALAAVEPNRLPFPLGNARFAAAAVPAVRTAAERAEEGPCKECCFEPSKGSLHESSLHWGGRGELISCSPIKPVPPTTDEFAIPVPENTVSAGRRSPACLDHRKQGLPAAGGADRLVATLPVLEPARFTGDMAQRGLLTGLPRGDAPGAVHALSCAVHAGGALRTAGIARATVGTVAQAPAVIRMMARRGDDWTVNFFPLCRDSP